MKTSAAGRAAIIQREGKRLVAYRDSVGVLTIGVGHTGRMSPPKVTPGMRITDAQCDAYLAADLAPVEAALAAVLRLPVTQNEWDAMISWLFNVGKGYAKPTTTIIRELNRGNVKAAAAGFDLFHRPPDIIGRRNQEKAQFLRPDAPTSTTSTSFVAARRAEALSRRADAAKSRADTAQSAGAVLAVGGAATAAATHAHHPWAAIAIGGGLLAAALLSAAVTIAAQRAARTLEVNAARQARQAAELSTQS